MEGKQKKKTETQGQWNKEAIINHFENRGRNIMHPFVFLFTWRREVADGKCFRRRETFLVELIQTVISTVETRHRQTHTQMDFHCLRPQSHIQLFTIFLVVFFFITLSVVCSMTYNVHERTLAPCAVTVLVHVLPSSSTVVMGVGGRGGGGSDQ